MTDEKVKHNHTGQTPSDNPSDKLIHPPSKKGSRKGTVKSDFNTIAKDPKLGSRNETGR